MRKSTTLLAAVLAVCTAYVGTSYAIFGIGAHYVLDFSVSMPDAEDDALVFEDLRMNATGFGGAFASDLASQIFEPEDIPIYFDRTGWKRTPFALGGKVYVDIIPFIDVIEIGGGIACWEYTGLIRYPTGIRVTADPAGDTSLLSLQDAGIVEVDYETMDLTLEGNGIRFPGISGTPYVKLDMGLTIRKYIPVPVVDKVLRPYAGAGFDVHFATPVPSSGLISDALGDALEGQKSFQDVANIMGSNENAKKVTQEILNRLFTPHYGMNFVAGLMVKPPVIPIGIYVDGKLVIPFGPLDKDADVKGLGFKLNMGLVLHFGKSKD